MKRIMLVMLVLVQVVFLTGCGLESGYNSKPIYTQTRRPLYDDLESKYNADIEKIYEEYERQRLEHRVRELEEDKMNRELKLW